MGDLVGRLVGLFVGFGVGDLVGLNMGEAEGSAGVGSRRVSMLKVGTPVGEWVGGSGICQRCTGVGADFLLELLLPLFPRGPFPLEGIP